MKYLPDYPPTRKPNRKFLFNIINTVYPGKLQGWLRKIKKEKKKKTVGQKQEFVTMTQDYYDDLNKFESLYKPKQKSGLSFIGKMKEGRK